MTAQKAMNFQGSLLKIGNGASPEVFNTVGQLQGFNDVGPQRSVLDATTTESTAREKVSGLIDGGQITNPLLYDPTDTNGQQAMLAALADGLERNFQIVLPDSPATTVEFAGLVTMFKISGAVDQLIQANITIDVNGLYTGL